MPDPLGRWHGVGRSPHRSFQVLAGAAFFKGAAGVVRLFDGRAPAGLRSWGFMNTCGVLTATVSRRQSVTCWWPG